MKDGELPIEQNSLVLYKMRPARVLSLGDKLLIELSHGDTVKVRPKDIALLHPGPLLSFDELQVQSGEVITAWEILSEGALTQEPIGLDTLAELAFGEYTAATAWATWQYVEDGLYFSGSPEVVIVHPPQKVADERQYRQARAAEAQAWSSFLERVKKGAFHPTEDHRFLREVEDLALGQRDQSRTLRALGRSENREVAHAFLLEIAFWDHYINPYPVRLQLPLSTPDLELPGLPVEPRLDLTHLAAYAIDDQDNQDPDDAISLDGDCLWVHVADGAALIPPDSPIDKEARARGATLYLPEKRVPMLPPRAVSELGLGLNEISPALSFGITVNTQGEIEAVEVQSSWVRVTRTTYEDVNRQLQKEPFQGLFHLVKLYKLRREAHGALEINLPEAIVRLRGGRVDIRRILPLRSREIVREAMLMAGEATAQLALERGIPFIYATQDPPRIVQGESQNLPVSPDGEDFAGQFALLRRLSRSQVSSQPKAHVGLGLPFYSRVTSPLRRYADLVNHQQLRAHLAGMPVLDEGEILERIGAVEAVGGNLNRAEWLSRRHWTLVFFMENPGWRGEAVLIEKRGAQGRVIIPELAFETEIHLRKDRPLNSIMQLGLKYVNLADLRASFMIADP